MTNTVHGLSSKYLSHLILHLKRLFVNLHYPFRDGNVHYVKKPEYTIFVEARGLEDKLPMVKTKKFDIMYHCTGQENHHTSEIHMVYKFWYGWVKSEYSTFLTIHQERKQPILCLLHSCYTDTTNVCQIGQKRDPHFLIFILQFWYPVKFITIRQGWCVTPELQVTHSWRGLPPHTLTLRTSLVYKWHTTVHMEQH